MIAKLKGLLESREDHQVVLDVGGVGYALFCSGTTLKTLPVEGSPCVLYVEPVIRSEQITLFGFTTAEERALFRLLLTVQGVGGKVCIALLSALTPDALQQSIIAEDHVPLTEADGVGPKVAQRIVRELKDKTGGLVIVPTGGAGLPKTTSQIHLEAISALVNLGYKKPAAQMAVQKILTAQEGEIGLNQLIPLALKELTGA